MFTKSRYHVVLAVGAFLLVLTLGCPSNTNTTTTHISGLLNNSTAPQSQTWPMGARTAIDKPTTFNLRIRSSEALFVSNPPSSEDDMLAWVILSDPFGGRADQYIPFVFAYAGDGWYTSTISRSVPEWVGSSGQLQPAEWGLRVDKRSTEAMLQIGCEVIYTPYSPGKALEIAPILRQLLDFIKIR